MFWNFRSLLATSRSLSFVLTVLISLRANSRSTPSLDVAIGGEFLSNLFLTLPEPDGLPLFDPETEVSPVLGTEPGAEPGARPRVEPGGELGAELKAEPGAEKGAVSVAVSVAVPVAVTGAVPGAAPGTEPGT